MTELTGLCKLCGGGNWRPFALAQPIFAVSCQACGGVEWIGFLPEEWEKYVAPLSAR